MLKDLRPEEFMDMVKDIGISLWGDRHKLKRAIEEVKKENQEMTKETIIETDDVESTVVDEVPDDQPKTCELCEQSTQHFCITCGKKVCNLFCSEPADPSGFNEMIRKHKDNDPRCQPMMFECPTCE